MQYCRSVSIVSNGFVSDSEPEFSNETLITGGIIYTNYIDVNNLFAQTIVVGKDSSGNQTVGLIESKTYNGDITEDTTSMPSTNATAGWAINSYGLAEFYGMKATGGTFSNITTSGGAFNNVKTTNAILKGYLYTNNVPFEIVAMVNFRIEDFDSDTGYFTNYKTANVDFFKSVDTGKYVVKFKNSITTRIFKQWEVILLNIII